MRQTDVLIVGSGVAAFQLARKLRSDINVMIITKSHTFLYIYAEHSLIDR
ncbi:hypothetical protein [Pseudogracilibacillus sp. SO30301A]